MLVEMEKNNASDDFVYTKVYVFYASDGSYINIKLADRIELDNPEDATFLAERKKEKTRKQYDNLPTETKVNMYNFYKDPIQEIRDNNYKIKPKK